MIMHMSATPAFPSTKSARHEMIRDLLASESIGSQEGLRARLAERGIEVTQTTLSRDLMDLRATKIRDVSGALIYTVPTTTAVLPMTLKLPTSVWHAGASFSLLPP